MKVKTEQADEMSKEKGGGGGVREVCARAGGLGAFVGAWHLPFTRVPNTHTHKVGDKVRATTWNLPAPESASHAPIGSFPNDSNVVPLQ